MNQKYLSPYLAKIMSVVQEGLRQNVVHLATEDTLYNGRKVTINGKRLVNFASCNYSGLALDDRLAKGVVDGVVRYGTSFPTSRSFISMGYLEELEAKLETLFGYPCLLTTSTSLGHITWLPLLVKKEDVVILDHQVHNSVSTVSEFLKAKGTEVTTIRHNRIDALEEKIIDYSKTHESIWYLADGIYSMYGDRAPVKELSMLLDKYENFNVYIDDAHGMGWLGKNGEGHVLSEAPLHPRMALITSLGKSFGSIGGAMIFPDREAKALVKSCGGPLIFSSPMPASVIGASLASAEIHLSDELQEIQSRLMDRIRFFKEVAMHLDIPVLGKGDTPIFFIPSGNPESCFALTKKMMEAGYYQSSAVFPSVPVNNGGMRYTITNHIEKEDIENMLTALARERKHVLSKKGFSEDRIKKSFKGVSFLSSVE